jgi:hypothetical protein
MLKISVFTLLTHFVATQFNVLVTFLFLFRKLVLYWLITVLIKLFYAGVTKSAQFYLI